MDTKLKLDSRKRVRLAARIDWACCITGGAVAIFGFGLICIDHQAMALIGLNAAIAAVGLCLCGQAAKFIIKR
jgi:hypothetical protein